MKRTPCIVALLFVVLIGVLLLSRGSLKGMMGDRIPPRATDALPGSLIISRIASLDAAERDHVFEAELLAGNLPERLRLLEEVVVAVPYHHRTVHVRFYVMPDVLAVGSDRDFVRTPLRPGTAQRIADRWGFVLPTARMSDCIYRAARVQLDPIPLTEAREATATFARHNRLIEEQRAGREGLVAGNKKDVVRSSTTPEGHVALYGWHRPDGRPIQPLYTGHRAEYVDYSHGIRLVWHILLVDGRPMEFDDLCADQELRCAVTDEEGFTGAPYPYDPQ